MNYLQKLKALDAPITTAIIGMGAMGKGLLYQTTVTPNVKCIAIADLDLEKAIRCAETFSFDYVVVETPEQLQTAVDENRLAVCQDGHLISRHCEMDALIESTSAITEGAKFVEEALKRSIHVVLMNAEIDLVHGFFFRKTAERNGVVCTSCDGDQHGVLKRLADDVRLWGFDIVMSGNIKGFLNIEANPTSIVPEADKRNLDYKMATAYTDGTKLAIEMALIANNLDLDLIQPGMVGPRMGSAKEVFDHFDFDQIRKDHPKGVVDYILGAEPGGGVFTVGYCEHPYQQELLAYYKMGKGPYYLFYRPYHLCHVEAMECLVAAVLDNECLLDQPLMKLDVYAHAKTDLKAGTVLDGLGGYHTYGKVHDNMSLGAEAALSICLSEGSILLKDIPKNQIIRQQDVDSSMNKHALFYHQWMYK